MMQTEIASRQDSYTELLAMINHLKETKKSKVPIKFGKLTSNRFSSPLKLPPTK